MMSPFQRHFKSTKVGIYKLNDLYLRNPEAGDLINEVMKMVMGNIA